MGAALTSWMERYGTALAGLAVLVGCALAAPNFTEGQNLLNVGKDAACLAILSVGFALALLVAELDLSGNALCSLPAPLATSVRCLRRLNLAHNSFVRLPQARLVETIVCFNRSI